MVMPVFMKNEIALCEWTEIITPARPNVTRRPTDIPQLTFNLPASMIVNGEVMIRAEQLVILRSALIIDGDDQPSQTDTFPPDLSMFVGEMEQTDLFNKAVRYTEADPDIILPYPTILNAGLTKDTLINGSFQLSMAFKSQTDKRYAMKVFLCQKKSVQDVMSNILFYPLRPTIKFLRELKEFMNADPEIQLQTTKVALTSSQSLTRIRIPVRGKHCKHLNPDDLEYYLEANVRTEKWECMFCKSSMNPNEMWIDQFYVNILREEKVALEINLHVNGRYQVTKIDNENSKSTSRVLSEPELIILDDDEEAQQASTTNSPNLASNSFSSTLSEEFKKSHSPTLIQQAPKSLSPTSFVPASKTSTPVVPNQVSKSLHPTLDQQASKLYSLTAPALKTSIPVVDVPNSKSSYPTSHVLGSKIYTPAETEPQVMIRRDTANNQMELSQTRTGMMEETMDVTPEPRLISKKTTPDLELALPIAPYPMALIIEDVGNYEGEIDQRVAIAPGQGKVIWNPLCGAINFFSPPTPIVRPTLSATECVNFSSTSAEKYDKTLMTSTNLQSSF
uniref:SP-RING-type domain-containing protein n=1 Tax=Rhabditophanes sp. KR3021 TaxID=114890 RepID=A0AC35TJ25_9BILA